MISFLYYLYERRLLREIRERPVPRHLGLILDGNRRYALERGFVDPLEAYALGARKLDDMLLWCDELSIPAVSLWVLSTENFRRDASEVSGILETRSEEHTSELQSRLHLVCRLLLEKKKKKIVKVE